MIYAALNFDSELKSNDNNENINSNNEKTNSAFSASKEPVGSSARTRWHSFIKVIIPAQIALLAS